MRAWGGNKKGKGCKVIKEGRSNVNSQNRLSLGDSVVWLREYVFPLMFPIQTSKPASARR